MAIRLIDGHRGAESAGASGISGDGAGAAGGPVHAGGAAGGSGAAGTAVLTGTVASIAVVFQGSGYATAPTVTISAPTIGGGTQATATATIDNVVTSCIITNGGSGYTSAPTVAFSSGGGTGAGGSGGSGVVVVSAPILDIGPRSVANKMCTSCTITTTGNGAQGNYVWTFDANDTFVIPSGAGPGGGLPPEDMFP